MKNYIVYLAVLALLAAGCRKEQKVEKPEQKAPGGVESYSKPTPSATAPQPQTPASAASTNVGSQMPAYEAKTLDGGTFDLASERGSVIFLNLWATWCGPCKIEVPELQRLHNQYGARGFKVVGVSLDDNPEVVQEFIKQYQITYPVVFDPDQKAANVFQTSMIPTSLVINRKGKIVWRRQMAIDPHDAELVKVIESALSSS